MGIDGGPLGFLSWSIPLICGTITANVVNEGVDPRNVLRMLGCGALLIIPTVVVSNHHMFLMYADMTVTIPFIHPENVEFLRRAANYWTMSQRAGSVTYTLFGSGFSLALFAIFRLVVDGFGFKWSYLDLLGRHALVAYVAHDLVMDTVKPFVPKDAPAWYVLLGFGVVLAALTVILRYFDRNRFAVRL